MERFLRSGAGVVATVGFLLLLGHFSPGLGCVAALTLTALAAGLHWWVSPAHHWAAAHQRTQLALERRNFSEAEIQARLALGHVSRPYAQSYVRRGLSLTMLSVALRGQGRGGGELIEDLEAALAEPRPAEGEPAGLLFVPFGIAFPQSQTRYDQLQAMLTTQLGEELVVAGRFDEAEGAAAQAARLCEELSGEPNAKALHAGVAALQAALEYERGNVAKAASNYRDAIELFEKAGLNRDLPNLRLNLGNAFSLATQHQRAAAEYEVALAGFEAGEPGGYASSLALLNLASALDQSGRTGDAVAQGRRGLNIRSRYVPEDDSRLAGFWMVLASAHAHAGERAEARAALRNAEQEWRPGLDADRDDALLAARGHVLECEEDWAGAQAAFTQLLERMTARKGAGHPGLLEPVTYLERHFARRNREEDAGRYRVEAERLRAKVSDV